MALLSRQDVKPAGFAVVDLETTGFSPASDRVVEIGVVQLDADARVTGEFATLINPGRDVGSTRVHGIRAVDVVAAPSYAAAAATVWRLLAGRVLVAHNAPFDLRFLRAEFGRCGAELPAAPVMCTMQLASRYLSGLPDRKLATCCAFAGITQSQQHAALDDARATAQLLAHYRGAQRQLPDAWRRDLADAALAPWGPGPVEAPFRPLNRN